MVSEHVPWVGIADADFVLEDGLRTAMGWLVDPAGLTELLVRTSRTYPDLPLMVTENGAAFADEVVLEDGEPRVHDELRTDYVRSHLLAVRDAMDAGADVRGYQLWSLLDNFEWAWGYDRRFGITHVDYDDPGAGPQGLGAVLRRRHRRERRRPPLTPPPSRSGLTFPRVRTGSVPVGRGTT